MVVDALSRKPKGVIASLLATNLQLLRELDDLLVEVILPAYQCQLAALHVTSPIVDKIKKHQKDDPKLMKFSKKVEEGKGCKLLRIGRKATLAIEEDP